MGDVFSWAIVGPGRIAQRFAQAVQALPQAQLVRVVGRDPQRAQDFANAWRQADQEPITATGDLLALLADPRVDAVYIATPHSEHATVLAQCLAAGKPVLCEKPLVPNVAQAQPLAALARSQRVFWMEAMWTRFLPAYTQVREWLVGGAIGRVRSIASSFCVPAPFDPANRMFAPALAGGALLDIGIYNLSMTRWVLQTALGHCPTLHDLHLHGVLAPTGVDQRISAHMVFAGDVTVRWACGLDAYAVNSLEIVGEAGSILVPQEFWQAQCASLQRPGEAPITVHTPFMVNGFEGEIEEAMRCIRAGLIESPYMPHQETLDTLAWMDQIRARLGVRYPFESSAAVTE